MQKKSITVSEKHAKFFKKQKASFNVSGFVRESLDFYIAYLKKQKRRKFQ